MKRTSSNYGSTIKIIFMTLALFCASLPAIAQQQTTSGAKPVRKSKTAARSRRNRVAKTPRADATSATDATKNATAATNSTAATTASDSGNLVKASARTGAPLPSVAPLAPSVDPFAAIKRAGTAGKTFDVKFTRTKLVDKAKANAQVSLEGQTLLVRMNAKDLPLPTQFDVPRYALWVYVPNYQIKMYIGDLPITIKNGRAVLGNSDSAYRFTVLPPEAEFGGLMLTAEPVRYTPIVNEALRPVLVFLSPQAKPDDVNAAPAIYAGPVPDQYKVKKDSVTNPTNK